MVFGPTQRHSGKPSHIDFHAFSKVKKLPILRAGGGGNLGNWRKKWYSLLRRLSRRLWFKNKWSESWLCVFYFWICTVGTFFNLHCEVVLLVFFIVTSLCFKQREKKTKKSYDNNNNILSFQPICVSSNFLKILKPYPRLALASRGETSQTLSGTSASARWTSSSPAAKNLPMYLPVQWIFWT